MEGRSSCVYTFSSSSAFVKVSKLENVLSVAKLMGMHQNSKNKHNKTRNDNEKWQFDQFFSRYFLMVCGVVLYTRTDIFFLA
jgi:Flp pilus assembly protein TadG